MDIYYGAAAAACGLLIAFVNYLIAKRALASGKMGLLPVRTLITAAFIAALYFIGSALKINVAALLIGGAAGLTLGLVIFTVILIKKQKGEER
jgi:hypothetical protein